MNERIGLVCKQEHFHDENFIRICNDFLIEPVRYHRKMWEFVFIFRMLELSEKLNSNSIGLGVGCGYERLVPAMVKTGVNLHVTDLENTWFGLDDTTWKDFFPIVCEESAFNSQVQLGNVDMNNIPIEYLQGNYDFLWSSCAFEHTGGLLKGMDFVVKSLQALKVGGISIHTTEFNIRDNYTMDTAHSCAYRKMDFEWLKQHVESIGYIFHHIDYDLGEMEYDNKIDHPPYSNDEHLKLNVDGFDLTSIGFIIEREK